MSFPEPEDAIAEYLYVLAADETVWRITVHDAVPAAYTARDFDADLDVDPLGVGSYTNYRGTVGGNRPSVIADGDFWYARNVGWRYATSTFSYQTRSQLSEATGLFGLYATIQTKANASLWLHLETGDNTETAGLDDATEFANINGTANYADVAAAVAAILGADGYGLR